MGFRGDERVGCGLEVLVSFLVTCWVLRVRGCRGRGCRDGGLGDGGHLWFWHVGSTVGEGKGVAGGGWCVRGVEGVLGGGVGRGKLEWRVVMSGGWKYWGGRGVGSYGMGLVDGIKGVTWGCRRGRAFAGLLW
ncbi:hypothetical protein Tco_1392036 [Tanacetum coccineum]